MLLKKIDKSKNKGFTLVELIIIVVFIGVFTAIAFTRTQSGLNIIQEQIAIDQITNDIDLVRSMAFASHDTITIQFSTTNGEFDKSYSIYRGPNSNRILISDFPNSDGGIISLDNYRMRGVEIKSINFNNSYELQFIPLGDCDLTSEGSITLNSKTINIEPLTGRWTIN